MIEHDSVVLSRPYGYITKEVLQSILRQNIRHTDLLKKQNKQPLILTDLSKVTGISPGARSATAEIKHFASAKSALYGANAFITLIAHYVIRMSQVGGNTRIFSTKRQALDWLQDKKSIPRPGIARLIAVAIVAMGTMVVVGWYLGIDMLRSLGPLLDPINIVVGVNFAVAGLCLFLLTFRKMLWRVILASVGAVWLVIFGMVVVLKSRAGINIPIDTWTFPAKFNLEVPPCPEPVAFLLMLAGVMILLATTPLVRKMPGQIFRGAMIISVLMILVLVIAFGLDLTDARMLSMLMVMLGIDAALVLITYRNPGRFPVARRIMQRYGEGIGIFVVIAIVSIFAWQRALQIEESDTLNRTADAVTTEIDSSVDVLRGYRAFFRSSVFVDASEFNSYFTESGLRESNPGIVSIGFLQNTPSAGGSRYPITFVTPGSSAANYGVDMGTDQETRQLFEKARDTGRIISSDDVDHTPLVKGAPHHELLTMAALYDASDGEPMTVTERRNRLRGFVVAEFDYDSFFSSFFDNFPTDKNIPLIVSDVHDGRILYRSPAAQGNTNDIISTRIITVADHSWSISILKHSLGMGGIFFGPTTVLLGGVMLGILVASLVVVLARRRQAVLELAETITADLEVERNHAMQIARKDDAIIADIGDALVVIDAKGRVILTNSRFAELFGQTSDEVMGRNFYEVLVLVDARGRVVPERQRPITRSLHGNTKVTVSLSDGLYYKRRDGVVFPAAYTVSPIEADGKVSGVIEIIRDISAEAEIDRAKTEFISLASHQLRTPLTAAKWYSELLLDGEVGALEPAQEKYVQKVRSATLRTIELVGSLLNLSRLEMRSIMVEPKLTDVVKLAQEMIKDAAEQISSRKVIMRERYSERPIMVRVDPDLMRIMIENLLSNAIKYSPEGATITLAVMTDKDGTLISVQDTGYGIPKQQQDKIFTKLFRADNIKTKDTQGSGLGLALVKTLVEYSGGEIWFESVEDVGSSFYIRIPPSGMKRKAGSKQLVS